MPKTSKVTALQKARRALKGIQLEIADSSSDSEASEKSAEFSHVPVHNIPDLENLSLENNSEKGMEQLVAQMGSLSRLLEEMKNRQEQQQQMLDALTLGHEEPNTIQSIAPQQTPVSVDTLFKIPDPIKSIPKFDGNRKQLTAWLSSSENTLNVFKGLVPEQQFNIFVTAVINKIEGRAKDIICLAGNPTSFEEVKEILVNALGDRQELTFYKSQLWQTRMTDNMSVHKYFNRCKEIVQSIKTLAKQKPKYKDNWDAINSFIEEDALAAFLAGLKEPYFGYAQAARPEDMEAAYAFVCKFKCKETTASKMDSYSKNYQTKEFRSQNFKKPQFEKNRTERAEPNKDIPEPMDVGSSKSKLTLNRRQVNNNEVSDSDSESEVETADINFCWVQPKSKIT